jgi:hypothetical protein
VTKDQIAAIRMTFPDGKVVDKPFGAMMEGGYKNKGGKHGGGGGGWTKDASQRPVKSLVLKDGRVVALPKREKPFAKGDVASVSMKFADGSSKTYTPGQPRPAESGAPKQRPVEVTIALKNGTTITKTPGAKRP